MNSNRFPLQNAIKKILDNPSTRPVLPVLKDSSSTGDGTSVGDKNFGEAKFYDKGKSPDIALNNGNVVVEVHESQNHNTLWYRVGTVNGGTINWEKNNGKESTQYDNGVQPSIAINNNGLVVEVHEKSVGTGKQVQSHVWYRGIGQVKNNTIDGWDDKKSSQDYSDGEVPKVACNGQLAVEIHQEGSDKLLYSVLTLPAFRSNWINLSGDNSYCYCACNSATNNKQRHASSHTMNIKAGAPYLYAVLTKDDDSIDFPTGAILTIEGPDGTKYDHNIQEENLLVIMSGSSVRCLIVKNPKPGNWKMTMTVPEGVGFHCECNTVPSTDVYDTITETLENSLQKRDLDISSALGWIGVTAGILVMTAAAVFTGGLAAPLAYEFTTMSIGLGLVSIGSQQVILNRSQRIQKGKAVTSFLNQNKKQTSSRKQTAQIIAAIAATTTEKKKQKIPALLTWNMQGANWNNVAASPWYEVKKWIIKGNSPIANNFPYKIIVACFQECGSPPPSLTPYEVNVDGIVGLEKYFWFDVRSNFYLYILFHKWDTNSGRVNLAVVSTTDIDTRMYIQGFLRPLIGIKNWGSYFFSIHAASGNSQGGDAWPLLRQVKNQVNDSWWVAGDYNQEPQLLTQRLNANNVNVTVCPPNAITRPASGRKLDYAVRNENANVINGVVGGFGAGLSDHLPVVYRL